MSKKINVVLYNSETKKFTEETVGHYKDYYKLLNCSMFEITMPSEDISLYVDEEGLYNSGSSVAEIRHGDHYRNMIAGNIVFTGGVSNSGNSLSFEGGIERAKAMLYGTNKVVK